MSRATPKLGNPATTTHKNVTPLTEVASETNPISGTVHKILRVSHALQADSSSVPRVRIAIDAVVS
jgi:hypothetical protein